MRATLIAGLVLAHVLPAVAQDGVPPRILLRPSQADAAMTVRELFAITNERERANAQRFEAQEKAVAFALAAAKEAVDKAQAAAEKRFDSVNEFRNTLKDQQVTLLPRAEAEIRYKSIEEKIANIQLMISASRGQSEGAGWLWSIAAAVAGLLIGALGAFAAWRRGPA